MWYVVTALGFGFIVLSITLHRLRMQQEKHAALCKVFFKSTLDREVQILNMHLDLVYMLRDIKQRQIANALMLKAPTDYRDIRNN